MDAFSGNQISLQPNAHMILSEQKDSKTDSSETLSESNLMEKMINISHSIHLIETMDEKASIKKIPSGELSASLTPRSTHIKLACNLTKKKPKEKKEVKISQPRERLSEDEYNVLPSLAHSAVRNSFSEPFMIPRKAEGANAFNQEEPVSKKSIKMRPGFASSSPNSAKHSPRQEKKEKNNSLLPEKFMLGQSEFIKFIEAKPLSLDAYPHTSDRKKFDKNIIFKLKEVLKSIPSNSSLEIENQIYEYAQSSIKELFLNKDYDINTYLNHSMERISILLSIIQNGGLLVQNILPQLAMLRNNLAAYLDQNKEKSDLTEQLYSHLQQLTEIDTLSTFQGTTTCGKRIHYFLATLKKILQTNPKYSKEERAAKEIKIKSYPFDFNIIKNLILQAIEGCPSDEENFKEGSYVNALQIINTLEFWAQPGEGGLSKNFQKLLAYCEKIAILCHKAIKLSTVEYRCFIEHFYRSSGSKEKLVKPNSFKKESKKASSYFMFAKNPEEIVTLNGTRIYNTSYSAKAVKNFVESLIKNESILPDLIKINDVLFFDKKEIKSLTNFIPSISSTSASLKRFEWKRWSYDDKTLDILANFVNCCYKNNFISRYASNHTIITQAELIKTYYDFPEKWSYQGEQLHPPILEEQIPCLKIGELMTISCMNVAITYIEQLFPDFFPELYNKDSPYTVLFKEGFLEHHIFINDENNFNVTQINEFSICLKKNPQEILATVIYSWRNEPTQASDKIQGWNAVLDINYKIHSTDHWEPITNILVNANDVTARKSVTPGIHYSRVINSKKANHAILSHSSVTHLDKRKF